MKKVEIYLTGGFAIQLNEFFGAMLAILDNKKVAPDEYIFSKLDDGHRTAYRKGDIVGICEYDDELSETRG